MAGRHGDYIFYYIVVGYVTPRPRYACAVRTIRVPVPGTRTQVYNSQEAATCVLAMY